MTIELELNRVFQAAGLKLFHTVPMKVDLPYSVYDRLDGARNLFPGYDMAVFAIDVYGKDLAQVLYQVELVCDLFEELERSNGNIYRATVERMVDNSDSQDIVYTLTVELKFRRFRR